MKRSIGTTVALGCVATLLPALTLASGAAPAAGTSCTKRDTVATTTEGRHVWIPSSLVTPFTSGRGSIDVSWTTGEDFARTKGSATTIGQEGGLNLGPVASVSASYDEEWNKSTTASQSATTTFTRTFDVPRKGKWRIRWYQAGREFEYTKRMFYTNCPMTESTWRVRVPLSKKPTFKRLIAKESFRKRNAVLY